MAKHNAKGVLSHYRREEIGSKTNKNRILIQTRLSSASRTAAILMLNRQSTVLNILSNQDIGTQTILPPILKPGKDAKRLKPSGCLMSQAAGVNRQQSEYPH